MELFLCLISLYIFIIILKKKKKSSKHLIVTGASSSHELSLIQFIYYCYNNNNNVIIIVWDLGFSNGFIKTMKLLTKHNKYIIYRKFNYSLYPSFFNINNNKGEYAWKAIIINITFYIYKRNILWLDSGCIVNSTLDRVFHDIDVYSCWSIYSSGTIKKWTHIGMINYFNITNNITKKRICAGGLVGFKWKSKISNSLLSEWVKCSFNQKCISPNGSNRYNHRQDQSALSILLYKYNIFQSCPFNTYNIFTHKDLHNKRKAIIMLNKMINMNKMI